MKVSIDFDGTLWDHMGFFRHLMTSLQSDGHEVGILTGHDIEGKAQDVALMRARGFPEPDFFYGKVTEADRGTNGAVFKARMILTEGIDIHFDDYDYENGETEALFRELLGEQLYRLVRVHHRLPLSEHFE